MSKVLVKDYTFDASAQTITFNAYSEIDIERVLVISNVVDNVIIYNFCDPALGGTVSGNVLTLTYDTTSMSDSDSLQIFYQDKRESTLGVNSSNEASNSSYSNWATNTWTGVGEQNDYSHVGVSLQTDDDGGTLYFDFSVDGTNWTTFPVAGFTITSGTHEIHTAVKLGRYFRARFVGSGNRTYFRLFTYYENSAIQLNSPLNFSMSSDSDGVIVKSAHAVQYQTTASSVADGDYDTPSITRHRQVRTRDQVALDIQDCNDATDFTVFNNDTDNLADSVNHQFGTGSITFDKVDGAGNTVYAGVYFSLNSIDIQELFEDGGFVALGCYLPSINNVVRVIMRLGTDASNYNEWRWEVDDLEASQWNQLRAATGRPDAYAGNGWNTADIDYGAVLVEFTSQSNTLAGIVIDNIHMVSGRVTTAEANVNITSNTSGSKIDITKVAGSAVDVNTGNSSTGTQRVVLASDQPTVDVEVIGHSAVGTAIKTVTTGGTAEQLATASCKRIHIQALFDNTGAVTIGDSNVVSAVDNTQRGVNLFPGQSITLEITNTNLLYVDAQVSGEGITYIYEN